MHMFTSPTTYEFIIIWFTLLAMGIGVVAALVEARAKDRQGILIGLALVIGFAVIGLGAWIFLPH